MLFGPDLGSGADDEATSQEANDDFGTRVVKAGSRVSCSLLEATNEINDLHPQPFYTAEEVRSFRTLGLEPGGLIWMSVMSRLINFNCCRYQVTWFQRPQRTSP